MNFVIASNNKKKADELERILKPLGISVNSAYTLVMAQGQKEIEAVQKMMNLSESEVQFLTTASQGEGLFVIGGETRFPIQIDLRDEEKELFGNAGGR